MRLVIEAVRGPSAGELWAVEEGETVLIEPRSSGVRLAITVSRGVPQATNLADQQVFLNGSPLFRAEIHSGDQFIAASSLFRAYALTAAGDAVFERAVDRFRSDSRLRAYAALASQTEPVYALLDAARDDRVLRMLRSSAVQYRSLYDGASERELADVAPYLACVPPDSELLRQLVSEAWGEGWGVYVSCAEPFGRLRSHFRRFLLVETEDRRQLYFRFYDPRVLRSFLPTCTPEEVQFIFGPVSSFWMEDSDPSVLLRFSPHELGCRCDQLPLEIALETSGQKPC
jgi:hypothetical protein